MTERMVESKEICDRGRLGIGRGQGEPERGVVHDLF
jgi:hypothetical protein